MVVKLNSRKVYAFKVWLFFTKLLHLNVFQTAIPSYKLLVIKQVQYNLPFPFTSTAPDNLVIDDL